MALKDKRLVGKMLVCIEDANIWLNSVQYVFGSSYHNQSFLPDDLKERIQPPSTAAS